MADGGYKTYQCQVCLREFSKPHSMKIHLRIHTGERPFRCTYCPKAFTTSGNLSDHLRVHSTARMFKCKICGARFKRNSTLKKHITLHTRHNPDKKYEENASIVVSTGNDGEIVHAADMNEPVYFERIDRTLDIITSEQNETVQTEIVHHPSHVNFNPLQDQHSPTIELLLPPVNDGYQEGIIQNHSSIKEENLYDFCDAVILELSEELNIEGEQVKVYSFPKYVESQPQEEEEQKIKMDNVSVSEAKSVVNIPKSDRNNEVQKKQRNSDIVQLDISNRFGAYVTKILNLLHSKEKQVLLIKELNRTIHDFHVENR